SELEALYQDLLIAVTSFFRNPETFEALKQKVFPKVMSDRSPDDSVRVWVVGCSTGQEAYSIAMAFLEYSSHISQNVRLQVFATDLNDGLLEKARGGLYSKSLVHDVSPERLHRFFVEEEGGYRVSKSIREMCVFARQNIITDPPFSRMDLISCRNLLIYLEPDLQRKLLPTFHYALRKDGVLVLGLSESVGTFTSLFAPVDKKLKIFAKKPGQTQQVPHVPLVPGAPLRIVQGKSLPAETRDMLSDELSAQREADRIALARYGPPGVVINSELEIVQFRGNTSPYLTPPRGPASFNVLKMAREELMLPLRAAINKVKKENKRTRKEDVRVNQNGSTRIINLEVIPLKNVKEPSFLVLFEPAELPTAKRSIPVAPQKPAAKSERQKENREIARLEQELAETRDYLQAVQEQYDAANEELQASAEEMQSANEELQSINEELETSKEELESTNEELTTVNEEMANRNTELTRLNNDMVNLQSSVNLAILLLGRDLSIRRFTQPAERIFNLMANDIGRPIANVRHNLEFANLEQVIDEVIENLTAQDHEVRDKDGRWFLLRVRPYMTLDNKIDGAVLVLIDITNQKQNEEARSRLAAIVESSDDAIASKDLNGIITSWNRGAETLFGYTAQEAIGKSIVLLLIPAERTAEESRIMERIRRGERIEHYETVRRRKDGTLVDVSLTVSPITDEHGNIVGASKIAHDISARKRAEEERVALLLREQNARAEAEAANRLKDEFLAIVSHEVRTPLTSIVGWIHLLRSGRLDEEHIAKGLEAIDRNAALQGIIINELLETSRIVSGNLKLDSKPVALSSIIEAAIEIVRPAAEAKSIHIETSLATNAGPIWGDSARLQQVFWNLVSNAVKFTPKEGRVDIQLKRVDSSAKVVMKDTGEGIEADFLPYVFDRFRQADGTTTRRYGGLGLGLSIVRNVVEMHGGSVHAASEGKGQGATFTVTLPIMPVSDLLTKVETSDGSQTFVGALSTTTRAEIVRLDGLRVLVVDDHEDTRELLKVALTDSAADVRTCSSCTDALATIETWKPDCIISDVGMPGEDGYELIKKVRALRRKDGGRIPAIALSGFAGAEDKLRATAAGYQVHISKPVDLGNLTSQIATLVQSNTKTTLDD
ncbi:MAG TPA: CheR family methyltransferase, partial [Pyrinomonadaceae bacterium]|nr:CheR family methyltransferase [Pyrinomonadaceae bacterium]